jgi:hypothetical protein
VGQIIAAAGIQEMPLSDNTRRMIDEEIGRIVDTAYADAVALLATHRVELDALAGELLERKQLDRVQLTRILRSIVGGGRRSPAQVGALPIVDRPPAMPGPSASPVPVHEEASAPDSTLRERIREAGREPGDRGLPRRVRAGRRQGAPRSQRIRSGATAAAATLYGIALPRVHALGLRRRERKRAKITYKSPTKSHP